MRVVILHNEVAAGATAAERDVLVQVGAVRGSLDGLGFETTVLPCTLDLESVRQRVAAAEPDLVFNLVESLGGYDRLMYLATALLDVLGLPYTGAPTEAIFLSGNKLLAKSRLVEGGLPTPAWLSPSGYEGMADGPAGPARSPARFLIKTVSEHASLGLDGSCLHETQDVASLREMVRRQSAALGRPCFAEAYVEGREFNLSLLGGTSGPEVLPPAEIDFTAFPPGKPRIVDYRAKWDEGSFEFRHTPRTFDLPDSDGPLLARMGELARKCWTRFGLSGYARVDFRVDHRGQPWILEVNANPCLAPDAGFAAALERAGFGFREAIGRIVEEAGVTLPATGSPTP